ncbi:histidine kinase [Coraliomargarita algicola]|uniref:Histidine kinase n=1 Tax=Coraliomargarita algicola TaxID=3092156 RepID=A0ABZ0RWB5_9BACT|nr:histidine kinase [Coraliomargarita sp. J2-16]WPJ97294.1 histidine kinase [Coraliomargarita sp. J2-16]
MLPAHAEQQELSLDALEQRLAVIDEALAQLAPINLRGGAGSIGYRSDPREISEHTEWVQVDLGGEFPIDEIVLVPCLWRSTESGIQADGFPLSFQIIAGNGNEDEGQVIASYTEVDGLLPRIAPVVIPCSNTTASWIRVNADRLSPRGYDGQYILQLTELFVFSGSENVALKRPVTASTQGPVLAIPWGARYLTDGFVPYLMDESHGWKSNAWMSSVISTDTPAITIDLKAPQTISRIHLHAIELSDTIPQGNINDPGTPKHLKIEASNDADFSDAVTLVDHQASSIFEMGPILMWNLPETRCRFVRLTGLPTDDHDDRGTTKSFIGFAEIEIFSEGQNVAYGIQASVNFDAPKVDRDISTLTDGHNFYGKILPIRQWIQELAQRHELEKERPIVMAELSQRYASQKTHFKRLIWLAALLIVSIGAIILIDRIIRLRQIALIKERLAADLHDELGANIHSIRMLSDLAQDTESPDEWKSTHQRILMLANRTTTAIRYCTNILEAKGLFIGLVSDMQRTAKRIGGNFDHSFSVEGEEWIEQLKPRTSIDLFLFYKEALINICRHSGATQVYTQLTANYKEIILIISDNGKGLSGQTPSSLKRRARLIGAQVDTVNPSTGGTQITLRLNYDKFKFLNPFRWRKIK